MLTTIAGLLLGFLAQFLRGWLGDLQKDRNAREAGAAGAKADVAEATLNQQTEIRDAEDRARARPDDELDRRLSEYSPRTSAKGTGH